VHKQPPLPHESVGESKKMRTEYDFCWLKSVFCIPFCALTLFAGPQEVHPISLKKTAPII